MGLFDFLKKKNRAANTETPPAAEPQLSQDQSVIEEPAIVFSMHLLFEEPVQMPEKDRALAVLNRHLGEVECFSYDAEGIAGFAAKNYTGEVGGKSISPLLNLCCCTDFDPQDKLDIMITSQMWDCTDEQKRDIPEKCRYQVLATDMLGGALSYAPRADMLMNYLDALVELYPECRAVFFPTAGKIFPADRIRSGDVPKNQRFLTYAVNRRFFNITGTEDEMIVDTLGMSFLELPDLQYHFRGFDVNEIICHAMNMLIYIFENDNPIKNGDTIDSISGGILNREVMWKCQYEDALIQPVRPVIDVNTGIHAAGNR